MTSTTTKTPSIDVEQAYLLSGYLNPQKSQGDPPHPKSGTLVPIADRFFAYLNHTHQETLVTTDAKGRMHSFNSKLEPLMSRQYIVTHPMRLKVLPQGLARQAFFANLEDWQKVLVEEIRNAKLKHDHKTIPFQFEKKDLKKPEEDDEAGQEAYAGFKEGVKYRGHLFPRVQAVIFLVPAGILGRGKYKVTLLKEGKVVTTFAEFGNGRKRTFETRNSLTQALEKTEYLCYSLASTDGSLAEGFYTLEIPGSALRKECFPEGSPALAQGLRFGCDVKFSLRTLHGDFDYHVLTPVSVESALLSNFPDTFAHVRKALFTPGVPGGGGGGGGGESGGNVRASQSVKTTLRSWADGYEWAHAKRQMALGYLNAENDERMHDLFEAVLGILDNVESEALRSSAEAVKTFWGAGKALPSLWRDWKRISESFKILKENQDKLRLVRQAVDANFFTRAFKETRWQRYIIEELREAEKLRKDGKAVTSKFVLELARKDASPQALRKLMADGIPREATKFEKLFGSSSQVAANAVWFLDSAFTLHTAFSAARGLARKGAEAEVQERRLAEAISRYADKYQGALHPLVLERLDGLRRLSDAARIGLTDAQREALTNSVEFALKTAMVVPVLGEFAGLAVLGLEARDLLQGISRTVYEAYCPDAAAAGKRLELLDKEYAANVRILIDKGRAGHETDPTAQFRLRALALMGFLRLLHRCGSRVAISDDFERKVREYRLEEYLNTFLLNPKPVRFPVYAGLFIDNLWVHSNPGKHPEWKETWEVDGGGAGAGKGARNSLGSRALAWSGAAHVSVSGGSYTLDFQKHFPIHAMDAKGVMEQAETFCTNFDGTITQEPAGGSILAREDGDSRWVPVQDCSFPITPLTEIRVAVFFRGYKDLTGVPLSFQLIRTDFPFEIHGPVYETLVVPAVMSLDGRGEDQGLLPEEKHFADGHHFCAVVHPHYTFRGVLYKGVKPTGTIGVTSHAKMEVAFNFFAGTGGKKGRIKTGKSSTEFTVHLPLNLSPMHQMIHERPFLECRSDKQAFRKLFYDLNLPRYVGVILKKTGDKKDNSYVYYPGSVEELKKAAFYFSWKDEFEMLLLFHSRAYAEGWEQQKTIRFPAFIQTQEFTGIDSVGPEYPVEVCSLRTHQLQRPGTVTLESLQAELKELKLLKAEAVLPSGPVEFQEPGYLWACLAKFAYSVEKEPDEMRVRPWFKPFSGTWKDEKEEYTYGFSISTPEPLGLNIADFLEIKLPGLPKDFLSDTVIGKSGLVKKMVTEKRVHGSLEIRKVDL